MKFQLILLILCVRCTNVYTKLINPGAQIQLDQTVIDYAKGVGLSILNQKLSTIAIPDIEGNIGFYLYKVDIKVKPISIPASQSLVTLVPGKGVDIQISDVSVEIDGSYDVQLKIGIKYQKSGTLSINAHVSKASIVIEFGSDSAGRPTIKANSCMVTLDKVDVSFHGDVYDGILTSLVSLVREQVKEMLNVRICIEISYFINENLESALQRIPVLKTIDTPIGTYTIDYQLVDPPVIGSDYIRFNLKALVTSPASPNPPFVAPPVTSFKTDPRRMFYITLTPYLLDTLGYALLKSNQLNQYFTPPDLDKIYPGIGKFMNTTCPSSTCIGKFVAGLSQKYPNTTIDIQTTVATAPSMTIGSLQGKPGVVLTLSGNVKLLTKEPKVEILNIDISVEANAMDIVLENTASGYLMTGQSHIVAADLKLKSSTVPVITQEYLNILWMAPKSLIDKQLNMLVSKGIAIPKIPYIELENVGFIPFLNNTLKAYGNVKYTG